MYCKLYISQSFVFVKDPLKGHILFHFYFSSLEILSRYSLVPTRLTKTFTLTSQRLSSMLGVGGVASEVNSRCCFHNG